MRTYTVEVVETHYMYVDANSIEEAKAQAEAEAFNNVPDSVESRVLCVEKS